MTAYTGSPALPAFLAGDIPSAATDWAAIIAALHGLTDAWTSFAPTWTATGTAPALGNGTIAGKYAQAGKLVIYRGRLDMGSTTTFGTGTWNFSIPVAFNTSSGQVGAVYLSDATGQSYPAASAFFSSIMFLTAQAGNVGPTVPFTWAVNDNLSWTVIYEAA